MADEEIMAIKCDGCGCAIVPELHEAKSGEYELRFFICPFCHKKYIISVTDAEQRKNIAEYCRLRAAAEKDLLSDGEVKQMLVLRQQNVERSRLLCELLVPKKDG